VASRSSEVNFTKNYTLLFTFFSQNGGVWGRSCSRQTILVGIFHARVHLQGLS